jgi:hypothetical protein
VTGKLVDEAGFGSRSIFSDKKHNVPYFKLIKPHVQNKVIRAAAYSLAKVKKQDKTGVGLPTTNRKQTGARA